MYLRGTEVENIPTMHVALGLYPAEGMVYIIKRKKYTVDLVTHRCLVPKKILEICRCTEFHTLL
jgi:hypothetical protein